MTANYSYSSKQSGIATLFTHEAVDLLGKGNVNFMAAKTQKSAIKIKCLNGNQTAEGLEQFVKTYEDVILVVARPEEVDGPMIMAANKQGVTILPANEVERIAESHWYPAAII